MCSVDCFSRLVLLSATAQCELLLPLIQGEGGLRENCQEVLVSGGEGSDVQSRAVGQTQRLQPGGG